MKRTLGGIALAALGIAISPSAALAQTAPPPEQTAPQPEQQNVADDEVVVTGSLIRGTPEDAALPVDVFRREELQAVGSPSIIELTRALPASQGINSESNQYGSNLVEGLANVNLRGLGPGRTLVLINGQRQAPAGFALAEFGQQQFVDTNSIPVAAIGRIEVLKDGAAATYGSDAVAGVVNFITRSTFEGLEIAGSAKQIGGGAFASDFYDYDLSGTFGWQGDRASWVTSVGYVTRDNIGFHEVDWATRSFANSGNGSAGLWSGTTNPGRYAPVTTPYGPGVTPGYASVGLYPSTSAVPVTGAPVQDPGCGSYVGGPGGEWGPISVGGACRFNSVAVANLVEDEERLQIFSEFNYDFQNGMKFHLEGLLAQSQAAYETSPSYPPPVQTLQYIPVNNPGLQDLIATNPGVLGPQFANGAVFLGRIFGPAGQGGFPGAKAGTTGTREYETDRIAAALSGDFGAGFMEGVNYDFHVTWSRSEAYGANEDLLTDRVRLGLLGLGGPNCNPLTGTAGVGNCQWLSTFSTNQYQHALGQSTINPNYVARANVNTPELVDWLIDLNSFTAVNELTVAEAIFSGESGIKLAGGPISWAAGGQIRAERYQLDPGALTDISLNPCNTIGNLSCGTTAGPFQFIPGRRAINSSRTVEALFAEASVPVTDDLQVQLAARYEQYGGDTGSTFDPKVQVRWQAASFLAFRASAQTTFRAPSLNQLDETATALEPLVFPNFIPYDLAGNRKLSPETAFNYNLGAIFNLDEISGSNVSFKATIDYWNFDLQDSVIREGSAVINGPLLAGGCTSTTTFYNRLTFQPGSTSGCGNVARVQVNLINGPEVKTDGVDVSTTLTIDEVAQGTLTFSVDGSYILNYDVGSYDYNGDGVLSAAGLFPEKGFSLVGFLNKSSGYRPLPQWKANMTARYVNGPHSLAVSGHYTTDYIDQRYANTSTAAGTTTQAAMRAIDSFMTWDATYSLDLPWDLNLGVTVFNIADEAPPEVYQENFYDPYTASPFGRMLKVGFVKKF